MVHFEFALLAEGMRARPKIEMKNSNPSPPLWATLLKWQKGTTYDIKLQAIWITALCCCMASPKYYGAGGTLIVMVTRWHFTPFGHLWLHVALRLHNKCEIWLQNALFIVCVTFKYIVRVDGGAMHNASTEQQQRKVPCKVIAKDWKSKVDRAVIWLYLPTALS